MCLNGNEGVRWEGLEEWVVRTGVKKGRRKGGCALLYSQRVWVGVDGHRWQGSRMVLPGDISAMAIPLEEFSWGDRVSEIQVDKLLKYKQWNSKLNREILIVITVKRNWRHIPESFKSQGSLSLASNHPPLTCLVIWGSVFWILWWRHFLGELSVHYDKWLCMLPSGGGIKII